MIWLNEELSNCINVQDWDALKFNGPKLVKIADKNKTTLANIKKLLKMNDGQIDVLVKHLKANNPEL